MTAVSLDLVWVHRNSAKQQYSLRSPGIPLWKEGQFRLVDVAFEVDEQARLQMLESGRKSLHAFMVGRRADWTPVPLFVLGVLYNPMKRDLFYTTTGQPVYRADEVWCTERGVFIRSV
jgi:hypothetical protein